MIKNIDKITERKRRVRQRAALEDPSARYCHIVGCKNPPTAKVGKGLNRRYCRKHEDHFERHGSYTKRSYTATEINPYRHAALQWIKQNEDKPFVTGAIMKVRRLYSHTGPYVEAFRLRGLKPKERANAAWARLRKKEVDPRVPLSIWLAVELITLDDLQPENKSEYKRVQAAKIIHRQASGTHKRWDQIDASGKPWVQELHKYPVSRGLVLRHIGKQIENAGELVLEHHWDALRAYLKSYTNV